MRALSAPAKGHRPLDSDRSVSKGVRLQRGAGQRPGNRPRLEEADQGTVVFTQPGAESGLGCSRISRTAALVSSIDRLVMSMIGQP